VLWNLRALNFLGHEKEPDRGPRSRKNQRDLGHSPAQRGAQINDDAYNARMAALYREVVLKEKPVQSEGGFIPLGALTAPANGKSNLQGIAPAPKAEVAEPVAGD
jgi:hypothetical protein